MQNKVQLKEGFKTSGALYKEMFEVYSELTKGQRRAMSMLLNAMETVEYAQKLFRKVAEDASRVAEQEVDYSFNELGELQMAREADQRLGEGKVKMRTALDVVNVMFDTDEDRAKVEQFFTFPE